MSDHLTDALSHWLPLEPPTSDDPCYFGIDRTYGSSFHESLVGTQEEVNRLLETINRHIENAMTSYKREWDEAYWGSPVPAEQQSEETEWEPTPWPSRSLSPSRAPEPVRKNILERRADTLMSVQELDELDMARIRGMPM